MEKRCKFYKEIKVDLVGRADKDGEKIAKKCINSYFESKKSFYLPDCPEHSPKCRFFENLKLVKITLAVDGDLSTYERLAISQALLKLNQEFQVESELIANTIEWDVIAWRQEIQKEADRMAWLKSINKCGCHAVEVGENKNGKKQ